MENANVLSDLALSCGSPLMRVPSGGDPASRRALPRMAARGDLVRLATGTYCPIDVWLQARPWERFRLTAVAHALSRREEAVFSADTALFLRGLPFARVPAHLSVLARSRGHAGFSPPVSPYSAGAVRKARRVPPGAVAPAPSDTLPWPVGVRRQWISDTGPAPDPEQVSVTMDDGTVIGAVLVDFLPRAMARTLSAGGLQDTAPPADALKRRHGTGADDLADLARSSLGRSARMRFDRAWAFADGRSESAGESLSRALISELGFVVPDLQHELHDGTGAWIARTDFWWRGIQKAGEFDGLAKYDVGLYATDAERRRAIAGEKTRELAIVRASRGVIRWIWEDVRTPQRFARLLEAEGVPRRRLR